MSLAKAIRKESRSYCANNGNRSDAVIASYNIHKCVGTDGRFDPARIAAVLGEIGADIIALQEADERFGDRAGLLDLRALELEFKLMAVGASANLRSHGWHGNVMLVRESMVSEIRQIRLPGLEPRGAIIVDLELKSIPVRLIAAHLGLLRRSRSQQTSALLDATHGDDRPTILLGDLNEWRVRKRSSLLPLTPHFGPVHAVVPSYPSRFPLLALDRILARPHSLISSIEVHDTPLARVASDHLPIKAHLDLGMAQQMAAANG